MDGHLKIAICQVSHMAVYHARYLISEYTFIFFPLSLFLRAIIMLLNVPKTKLEKLLTFFLFFFLLITDSMGGSFILILAKYASR